MCSRFHQELNSPVSDRPTHTELVRRNGTEKSFVKIIQTPEVAKSRFELGRQSRNLTAHVEKWLLQSQSSLLSSVTVLWERVRVLRLVCISPFSAQQLESGGLPLFHTRISRSNTNSSRAACLLIAYANNKFPEDYVPTGSPPPSNFLPDALILHVKLSFLPYFSHFAPCFLLVHDISFSWLTLVLFLDAAHTNSFVRQRLDFPPAIIVSLICLFSRAGAARSSCDGLFS